MLINIFFHMAKKQKNNNLVLQLCVNSLYSFFCLNKAFDAMSRAVDRVV